MASNHKGFIGVYQFAREMGWSVDWVYKQIQGGKLPAQKLGRKWQIARVELDAKKAQDMKRLGDWQKFRLLVKSTRHSNREPIRCAICQQAIITGQSYRDAGATGRAHESCVRAEKESR